MSDYIKIVIFLVITTLSLTPKVSFSDSSTINLTGQVPSVLYVNILPLPISANLPTNSHQESLKVANYNVRSNHPQSSLTVSCLSSPLDPTGCYLKNAGAGIDASAREKINYSVNIDQSSFNGITNYDGGIYITYSPDLTKLIPGNYSDTITISITFAE